MDAAAIERVRAFNRTVAERIGALNSQFLGRGRPMAESRTLWEIGAEGADVRELRARLGLDSGYLSRMLASLERQRLVTLSPNNHDRRVRTATLTRAGRVEKAMLDRRSDSLARSFLQPLGGAQRDRLVEAMSDVERLLTASMVEIDRVDPSTGDARWCVAQYFAELDSRFDGGFDPALSISADARELTLPAGELLMARLRGKPVACGALKFHGRAPAELKRMWVSPEIRGLGVGRRMLGELEHHAWQRGARVIHLETNRSLKEAIALYRASGYREVRAFNQEPYAHHWFEKRLGRSARTSGLEV